MSGFNLRRVKDQIAFLFKEKKPSWIVRKFRCTWSRIHNYSIYNYYSDLLYNSLTGSAISWPISSVDVESMLF